jgi:hypothetical protein
MNRELGIVFGYAFICNVNGEPHYNSKGGHFPEDVMLKASIKLMEQEYRPVYIEHDSWAAPCGRILFAFPLTQELGNTFGMPVDKTGLIVGIKLNDVAVFSDVKMEALPGFSVGFMYRAEKVDEKV